jgi:hypothetical protein
MIAAIRPSGIEHQLHVRCSISFRAGNGTSCLARERFALYMLFLKNLDPDFFEENACDSVSESLSILGSFHLAQRVGTFFRFWSFVLDCPTGMHAARSEI